MLRMSRVIGTSTMLVLLVAVACIAQGPGGPPPPGMGGQSGSNQSSQMREKYKYTFQLMQMTRHIMDINQDPKHTLTQAQAKKVLGVLQPLRGKPKMTQDEAKATLKKLKPIFTVAQLNAMARIKPPSRGPGRLGGGQGPGGGGASGGPPSGGQPGANRPSFDPNAMKDFNPFYSKAKAGDEFAQRRAKRWNEFFTSLDNKAKGKKATAKPTKKTTKPAATKKKTGK